MFGIDVFEEAAINGHTYMIIQIDKDYDFHDKIHNKDYDKKYQI